MSFKNDHPDYLSYQKGKYHINEFPDKFFHSLEGYIVRHCQGANDLKIVINDIASRIPCEITQNWGWNFLVSDLSTYLWTFRRSKFHKVMDFLSNFFERFQAVDLEDFNEFLDDLNIGYVLNYDAYQELSWELRENVECRIECINESEDDVKHICQQTLDHLNQAKDHLKNPENNRDRKDAIRDCMSAMEAMLKNITGQNDIKDATTFLRGDSKWGQSIICKDGLTIWNKLHDLYPDVRHGNPNESDLTDEEALYWVERIICFIKYIAKRHLQQA